MGDTEEAHSDRMQRLQSSFGTTSSRQSLTVDQLNNASQSQLSPNPNPSQFRPRNFPQTRPPSHPHQIPPLSPYSQIPATRPPANPHPPFNPTHHSRSLSQPAFFSLDSLPPLSPSPYRDSLPSPTSSSSIPIEHLSLSSPMDDRELTQFGKSPSLPPRKAHRRSNSDIPFGFSSFGGGGPPPPVKREQSPREGEAADDLFSAYMNLDGIEALNSSGTDENHHHHHREESSDNEAESSVNSASGGTKRRAGADISPAPSRHYRSVSFDSFMGGLSFGDESPKVPLSPGAGPGPGQLSPSNSVDGSFGLEIGNNGEFNEAEMKKIMANDKLTEIAMTDPKRVKRILANRQSAARSKERKTRYISELEHKVQTLQTEATTLSAQLTLLQRDSVGLTNHNNELKYRLQAMEQQAQLRDALSEALTTEVQRLKMSLTEINGNAQMFPMQQQFNNMSQSQSQSQNGGSAQKPESKQ